MSISQLCISVPLRTSCPDFTVNSKFSANRGSYLQCFSWLKHWKKRFCADFSRSVGTGGRWYEQNTSEYTYQRNETVFFPENSTDFVFQKLPEEIQSKIIYFCSLINEYSLRSRDVYSTPSWHKWSDFEYRPWCLAILVRTPPDLSLPCVTSSPSGHAPWLRSQKQLVNLPLLGQNGLRIWLTQFPLASGHGASPTW